MVINCKVQTGTSQGRAKGHKKKGNRYCQAMKLLTIAVVFFPLFLRAEGADVEDNEAVNLKRSLRSARMAVKLA